MSVMRTRCPDATSITRSYGRYPSRSTRSRCGPAATWRSICGVFPTGRPSRYTLPHGMAFTERKPGSGWRAGLLTTGARVVPDGRFGRTGAGVADERGAASRAGGRNVSLLALGAIGGAPVPGAGALATGSRLAGDAGIDEMPSHAAPPPSATSRPPAAAADRPPGGSPARGPPAGPRAPAP